ncbi:hypothetical protein STURON_00731 [Spiroplasma turonicum]|uniref:Uncharacterized protein n=1 Tax=Spiroplasma turonicum TaxID=216946 RepID=A0A0K1P7W7_9MOLU|nr:hypothetical protein STURON_00731 [Spiroplasma turonicum]
MFDHLWNWLSLLLIFIQNFIWATINKKYKINSFTIYLIEIYDNDLLSMKKSIAETKIIIKSIESIKLFFNNFSFWFLY